MLPALEYVDPALKALLDEEASTADEDCCVWEVDTILDSCVLALCCATFTIFFLQKELPKLNIFC